MGMGLISAIWLVVLGILGAANLIIAKKPEAKELIAKLAPYQGWIGAVSALWGVWSLIQIILNLGILTHVPLILITVLAAAIIQLALGLLLGVGVLKTFIKNEQAQQKMDETIARLAPKQGVLGLIAICVGAWYVIAGFILVPG